MGAAGEAGVKQKGIGAGKGGLGEVMNTRCFPGPSVLMTHLDPPYHSMLLNMPC